MATRLPQASALASPRILAKDHREIVVSVQLVALFLTFTQTGATTNRLLSTGTHKGDRKLEFQSQNLAGLGLSPGGPARP
jgi:hypothetical protein